MSDPSVRRGEDQKSFYVYITNDKIFNLVKFAALETSQDKAGYQCRFPWTQNIVTMLFENCVDLTALSPFWGIYKPPLNRGRVPTKIRAAVYRGLLNFQP
jgi:hypothetical protein